MKLVKITLLTILFVMSFTSLFANDELLNAKISIDAEDAKVSSIIATMAKLSGCNSVLALETENDDKESSTEKQITIHLKDVPIEQALSLVVKSVGLSYRLIGEKTFLVGDRARINEEIGERSYIVHLNYVDVEKVVKAFEIIPGECVAIEGQNALLIHANPGTFAEISKKIEQIDVPQKQIEIQARLIEVSVSEAEKYGIDWSKINSLTTIFAENNYTPELGAIAYNGGDESTLGSVPEDQNWQIIQNLTDAIPRYFGRQLTAFDVTIDWLLENNAAQLLTDTRITVLNGEDAEIHIGEVVPFVVENNDKQIQVEREEVGIKLKVTAKVNKDRQITATIEPEVSSVMELVGGYVPRTKVRRITSTVTVSDGKKIIVGGLLNTSTINTINKVPLLWRIPFIGKLFTHQVKTMNKTDLIIEITPKIVDYKGNVEFEIDEKLEKRLLQEKSQEIEKK